MKKLAFLLYFLTLSTALFCQNVRWDLGSPGGTGAATTSGSGLPFYVAVPGVQLNWCNVPANAVPCTNYANTYATLASTSPCPTNAQVVLQGSSTCQATGDNFGNLGVYTAAGTYAFTLTYSGQSYGPYVVSLNASGGGGGGSTSSVAPATVLFSQVNSVILTTSFISTPIVWGCWDMNNNAIPIFKGPQYSSTTPYTLTFTFAFAQSGHCDAFGVGPQGTPPPPPAGQFSVTPSSAAFGNVAIGTTSAPATISLTNNTAATITGITLFPVNGTNAADFAVPATTCGSTLAAASVCTYSVTFTPSIVGNESANFNIADSDPSSPQTITLTGTGFSNGSNTPTLTVIPSSWSFGTINIGQNVQTKFTFSAGPTAPVTFLGAPVVAGANFTLAFNLCPTLLAAGQACQIGITFAPTSAISSTGTLTVTDNAVGSPQVVSFSGTGQAAGPKTLIATSVAPPSTTNASVAVGSMLQLSCLYTFSDSSTQSIIGCPWLSSNTSDATVTNPGGLVTGVAPGTVTVTPNSGVYAAPGVNAFFASGSGGAGTPAFVGGNNAVNRCTSGATGTCTTTGATTTSGHLLVAACFSASSSAIVITDKYANTWTDFGSGFHNNSKVYYAKNITGGATHAVTCTGTSGTNVDLIVLEWSGASTTSPIDGTAAFATGTSTTASASVTTSHNASRVIGWGRSVNSLTVGGCCDSLSQAAFNFNEVLEEQSSPANAGSQTVTETLTSAAWVMWAGALTVGGSTPTTTLTTSVMPTVGGGSVPTSFVCAVGWGDATATLSTFTDTAGDTFTLVGSGVQAHGLSQYIYYSVGVAAATNETFTATWAATGALNPSINCGQWSGLLAYDTSAQSSSAGSTAPTTAITAGQASDFIVQFTTIAGTTSCSAFNAGATSRLTTSLGDNMAEYPIYASGSVSPAPGCTLATSEPWIFGAVAFNSATETGTAVTVSGTSAGPFTITNREPANNTSYEYPGSIFSTPLPSDAESHCWNNGDNGGTTCNSTSPDKVITNCIFSGGAGVCPNSTSGGSETNANFARISYLPSTYSGGLGAAGAFYAQCSDPIYYINSIQDAPDSKYNNPQSVYFHIPNQALTGNGTGSGDNFFLDWDQCTDNSAGSTQQRRLSLFGPSFGAALPACTCTTTSCALNTAGCNLTSEYGDYGYPLTDVIVYGEGGAFASLATVGQAMIDRGDEYIGGTLNHVDIVNLSCEDTSAVNFPAQPSSIASVCANTAHHAQPGMLFKIKSSYNCAALSATVLQAKCRQWQTYGALLSDTGGGNNNNGIIPSRQEGGGAFYYAGIGFPVLETTVTGSIANEINGTTIQCSGTIVNGTETYCTVQWANMPGLITGNNLEIIDQCVPKGMAGLPGGCP